MLTASRVCEHRGWNSEGVWRKGRGEGGEVVVQAGNSPESERLTKPTRACVSSFLREEKEEGFGKCNV